MARVLLAVLTLALLLTAGNITVIYFWQPNCPGCKYMEEVTFKDAQVQAFLAAVRFEKRDAREVQYVEAYAQRALVVEGASLTFLNGSLTTSGATKIRVVEVDGRGRFPILATPTVVVLEADAGEVYLRGYLLGALPPEQFLSFIKNATSPTPLQPAASSPATALAIAAALGAASAASPCVIVPQEEALRLLPRSGYRLRRVGRSSGAIGGATCLRQVHSRGLNRPLRRRVFAGPAGASLEGADSISQAVQGLRLSSRGIFAVSVSVSDSFRLSCSVLELFRPTPSTAT